MNIGVFWTNRHPYATPEGAHVLAEVAQAARIESIWASEHVVLPEAYDTKYPYSDDGRLPVASDFPYPDPLVWLTYMAALTNNIRLGTAAVVLPQRNPVILAKELATIDHLSAGRMMIGVGVGWFREEFAALGIPFDKRGERMDESILTMRALWSSDETFHGKYFDFDKARCHPKPVQPGGVPIIVCGHSDVAARRAGRLGDGFFPLGPRWAELGRLASRTAEEAGRNPNTLELTIGCETIPSVEEVASYAEQGVGRIVVHPPTFDLSRASEAFAELADKLVVPAAAYRPHSVVNRW